jgi:murein L,D-transpeptidase YcbB/YkuD
LPIALAFSRQFPVVGFDIHEGRIKKMRHGEDPCGEVPASGLESANKDVLPGLKKDRQYLDRHQRETFEGNTLLNTRHINWHSYPNRMPFNIRQKVGKDNSLIWFKLYLSNSFWIYLQDFNETYLFDAHHRAFSHGCIRVEKADELAWYLLRNDTV